jgi:hypothetical protein
MGYVPPVDRGPRAEADISIEGLREQLGLPEIKESDWEPMDFVTGFPEELIEDQDGEGACTAASDTGASARQRFIRTGQVVKLSWQFVYDQINGGQDNGSNIRDSMEVIENAGAPPAASYPKSLWVPGRVPSGVPMYKEGRRITVDSSSSCVIALMMGVFPQVPILATSDFVAGRNFSKNGMAWNGRAPSGRSSNHSIYLGGWDIVDGIKAFRLVNSWAVKGWSPLGDGTCWIPFEAVDNPAMQADGYAHAATVGGKVA